MKAAKTVAILLLVVVVGLVGYTILRPQLRPQTSTRSLMVYCAAGLKAPVEALAREYEKNYAVSIQLQFGGSGTLLSSLRISQQGDLFVSADESYLQVGRSNRLVQEIIPLAKMTPVLAVAKGNPKGLRALADLLRPDVRLALGNPEAAAIGQMTRQLLRASGQWEAILAHAKVLKPTVNDIANDLKIGAVDAGILWDAVVRQYPELESISLPELETGQQQVALGVLASCPHPASALHFARYLAARDRGLPMWARFGYQPVEGDVWAEVPQVVLFSGGVNRVAIEDTLQRFEEREGVRLTRVYNGCGILVAQMKAGQRPDAYFACDVSFMKQVADLFLDSLEVSETQMVILTPKGNPKGLKTVQDLAKPGLRLGLANPQQSALGALTQRLLEPLGLWEAVLANARTQTPTADLLVNQMRTGSLDAVIVYTANTSQVRGELDIVPIPLPAAHAIQPFAIARQSANHHLVERLLDALRTEASRRRFEEVGFVWKAN